MKTTQTLFTGLLCLLLMAAGNSTRADDLTVKVVDRPDTGQARNEFYTANREPLLPSPLIQLPFGSIKPQGWLKKQLELEADGFIGRLTEISPYCNTNNNAWLSPEGEGNSGWEEVPYWLRGYAALGYVLQDKRIMNLTKEFVEAAIASQTEFGWFGPRANVYTPIYPAIPPECFTTPDGKPGLAAEYFSDRELKTLKSKKIDPNINFVWKRDELIEGMKNENISARWTGRLTVKKTDDYVFAMFSDEGTRFWLDGELIIDNWRGGHYPSITAKKPVRLQAGKPYDIKVEFYQDGLGSGVRLGWKKPGAEYDLKYVYADPDLMPNMSMLFALRAYYEYSGDKRVIDLMTKYFKWQLSVPDKMFFSGGWQVPRNGDNMDSVYWLYNITGEPFLLELGEKLMRTGKTWMSGNETGGHNVDYSQGFRKPGQFYVQSKDAKHLQAAEGNYDSLHAIYGQVPGGMFGGDEFARPGHTGPEQAIETCGAAEMMLSQEILLRVTGDLKWADRCENITFNTLPATFTADQKALRYLTCPNQSSSDKRSRFPVLANGGAMQEMDPHSHRCCQHNSGMAWPYFAQNTWQATPGNGLAAVLYAPCDVIAQAGDGTKVKISEKTRYPFGDTIEMSFTVKKPVKFPLYLRVPAWCAAPEFTLNGTPVTVAATPGAFVMINRTWAAGDALTIKFPMKITLTTWAKNKNSVSVNRGPLTYSVKIGEKYVRSGGNDTWPAWEIFSTTPWNYGLIVDPDNLEKSFKVVKKAWPKSGQPFEWDQSPVELKVKARKIPNWVETFWGTVDALQQSPVKSSEPIEVITMIPMGAGRLRISALPLIGAGPDANEWQPFEEPAASCTHHAFPIAKMTDGKLPKSSSDRQGGKAGAFSWWPNAGSIEWVTQKFSEPKIVSSVEVYWYADNDATCMPEWWKLYYKDGREWKPVKNPGPYGLEKDTFNVVKFDPVKTTGLKLEAKLGGRSGGIFEWRVE